MATSTVQVQIHYVEGDVTAMFKFSPDITVSQACQTVEEHFCEGEPDKEFGLVRPTGKDLAQGVWLEQECTLSESDLRTGDCLQFICKYRPLTVKTLDGAVFNLMVDESQNVKQLIEAACIEIGVKSSEEFAFVTEEHLSKRRRTSLLSSKKVKSLRRKRLSGDDVKWLDPLKTLREQGVGEKEVLVLRKRFFFSEETVDGSDATEVSLVYGQSRDGILGGTYPVSKEEAIQFAALQCRVEMGVYSAKQHRQGCLRLASFVPKEYEKSKSIEKKILEEFKRLQQTLSDSDAKSRYIQLCRSLKTFGVTFFAVKEKMKGRNKMVPRLLGITRENITKMDDKTKEVLAVWPLHTVRRWASTSSSFSLDFGGYSDSFYSVQTTEGDAISQIISGYVDITVKKKRAREWRDSDQESVGSGAGSLEDSMEIPSDDVDGGCFAVEVTSTDLDSLLKKSLLSCDAAASQLAPSQVKSVVQWTPTAESAQVSTISSAVVAILSSTASLLASSAAELNSGERVKMAASFKTMAMSLNSLVTATQSAAAACPTAEDREHVRDTAHKLSIAAVHVLNTVQELQNSDKMQELQASARAVGTAGEYLLHVCEVPVLDLNTQKVIAVSSQDIIRRTAYLGQIAVNLVETCTDGDSDNDTAVKRRVAEVVDDLLDKSSVLAVSASLLSPLLAHPSCQDGLTEVVKMVADAAERTGVLTQPVCNSDSALSELAEAGSAVIDELQSLLAELSRCSLTSVCYHLEENLNLLSGAADRIVHCATGTADMMREAKAIGKGFECVVDLLNLQSEREEDPSAARALLDASKALTRASLNVIEGAKKLSYDADAGGQMALKAAATELQNVCTRVGMLVLMQQSAPRLVVAANNACTVTAQLIVAALEVSQDAGTGDSVQVELEGRSEAARCDLVTLLKVLEDSKCESPSGGGSLPVTTQAALSLVTSAGLLVGAVKSCVPVISDQAASLQLNTLAKATNTAIAELKTAASKALRVTQMEDLAGCSEALHGMLTEAVPTGQEPLGAGVLQLSATEYKARLSPAVQALAAAKRKLLAALGGTSVSEMVAATKEYVQAVKEWCHVMHHVTEDSAAGERTQDALREVLKHTNAIVLEVKAAAGAGGSVMAAIQKLEAVTLCVRAAVDAIEGGDVPTQNSSKDQPPVKKGWRRRLMEWFVLPVYRLIVWLICLPYVCTRYVLVKVYAALCFTLGLIHSAARWVVQLVYRCVCCLLRMAFVCILIICPPLGLGYLAIKFIRQRRGKRSAVKPNVLVNDSFSDVSSCGSSFDLSDDDDDDDDDDGDPTIIYGDTPNTREQVYDKAKVKVE